MSLRLLLAALFLACLPARASLDAIPPPVDLTPFATKAELPAQVSTVVGMRRYANSLIPAGNTVTSQSETAFTSKVSLPTSALATSGTRFTVLLFGRYSSMGVTPSIVPRIRLGGVELLPARTITGLLASNNVPWQARADFLVTDSGIVGTGVLTIDDNQVRIFGGPAVTGIDVTQALDLTASATWGQANCSITLQGFVVDVIKPAS